MIGNISEAARAVRELLNKNKEQITQTLFMNEGRHCVIKTAKGEFYVLFKREFFMSFGRIFNQKGVGESINEEFLMLAIQNKANAILVVYQDGKVYEVNPRAWKDFAETNNTIRVTEPKGDGYGNEKTYSIPVAIMKRMN